MTTKLFTFATASAIACALTISPPGPTPKVDMADTAAATRRASTAWAPR